MTMTDAAAPAPAHWQTLFQRLLGEMDGRTSPDWQADEAGLDPPPYVDPTRFRRERERLFRRMPLCLGPVDQLREPGSVMAREICGVPVLITRTREGDVKVFLNVCRHRGARLIADANESWGEPCKRQ